MEVIVSLLLLLLVTGAGGRSHANLAAAVAVTPSRTMTPNEYWQAVLPGTAVPLAIHEMLTRSTEHSSSYAKSMVQEEKAHEIEKCHSQRPDLVKIPRKIGQDSNLRKKMEKYVPCENQNSMGCKAARNHITLYGPQGEEDLRKITTTYDTHVEEDPWKFIMEKEYRGEQDSRKIRISYGTKFDGDISKINMSYASQDHEEDPKSISVSYGSQMVENPKSISVSYGSQIIEDPKSISVSYGSQITEDPKSISVLYRSKMVEDPKSISVSYGSQIIEDPTSILVSYGSQMTEDSKSISVSYDSQIVEDPKSISVSYGSHGDTTSKGERHAHIHSADNGSKMLLADVFFFHDALRPGSVITPIIPPTTSLPALLPRHVADSLPFSTERFADIIAMFKPASLAMAGEIRWALDTCEHPRPLPGEKAGCANSIESLVDLPAALLGTRNVRAFSADMTTDPAGTPARRTGRYNVTAVRKLSESPEIATCHDLTYPYAVFFCHTSNPTVAYAVTLERSVEEGAGEPSAAMEVLAVCHLDTSQWSPRNPFFVAHKLKPGDAAACHFLSKLSIVWVPADAVQGGASEAQ